MDESIWVLFSEFLGRPINCSVTVTKVFLCKSLASMLGQVSGFLGNLVDSGIAG
jgi:hypothetical protein